jgi:UDP-N-acetylglucosamine diphosphorylase / glucose-1-phosphate thymidylyltransferase / UDP-N-acetylgalactosamine diphosphorylase / glucosamine-1-phosphate N-acetyltransferase / galactosamine-1-phosphate N-acetyltransferase
MRKVIIRDRRKIAPFNEPARDLRVLNKPLWLWQRDVLAPYCTHELVVNSLEEIPQDAEETLAYQDNLFFDAPFIEAFVKGARALGKACRVAFSLNDPAIVTHALPLQGGIRREGNVYVGNLFYFPHGPEPLLRPLVVDTLAREIGYYHIPTYMAQDQGDLTYQVPLRAFLAIEHWIHIFIANSPFGIFADGARMEASLSRPTRLLHVFLRSILERRQFLSSSALVHVGRNTHIDPNAIIEGPTYIGDNCTIGNGVVITNCIIGNNVNIMEGCHVMLSVISDGCYLPFRAALFMSTLMENSMVAQNACLQMCVIGRDTFIGAGTTFTDFNLLERPIKSWHRGSLETVGLPVVGGCVGHHCRVGAGMIIYPARTIESDSVIFAEPGNTVVTRNILFEDSQHFDLPGAERHERQYPRGADGEYAGA